MTTRPGFLMMDLMRALYWVDEGLQNGLRAHGWAKVSRAQSLVLLNIAFGVHRASTLAVNLGVSRQAISQMLAEMQKAGLIDVRADPGDRRAQVVGFSPDSAKLREDAMRILEQINGEIVARIGAEAFTTLRDALACDWGPAPQPA